ncbi:MAG TPA: hypothetical protein VFT87_00275 [Candidatus Saccharimonadales bacterium]|nr:hypothetical protein [Candidatus Saccharimonadales bacterium]
MTTFKTNYLNPKRRFLLGLFVVAGLLVAAFIPVALPDGSERFSGPEKVVAQMAIGEMRDLYGNRHGIDRFTDLTPPLAFRVVEVERVKAPLVGVWKNCRGLYEVSMANISFYGLTGEPYSRLLCADEN